MYMYMHITMLMMQVVGLINEAFSLNLERIKWVSRGQVPWRFSDPFNAQHAG